MRFGGPIFEEHSDPDQWIAALGRLGYSAAYCPVDEHATADVVNAYATAAVRADVIVAEVGAWSNPISPDPVTRQAALSFCQERLALAEAIGARCCVNIAGSRGAQWADPHPGNLTAATFDMIVDSVRSIIDAVKPTRTFFTLETMPWAYPNSVDTYLDLIHAVDRAQFAAHLDLANLVYSPPLFLDHRPLIRDCVERLGPYIRSCHLKDLALTSPRPGFHIDEVRPGLGGLDHASYLREIAKLDRDTSVMLEHLSGTEDYMLAARHVRTVAREAEVDLL